MSHIKWWVFAVLLAPAFLVGGLSQVLAGKILPKPTSTSASFQQAEEYVGIVPDNEQAQSASFKNSGMIVQTGDTYVAPTTGGNDWEQYD